jgi:hypothetical protein
LTFNDERAYIPAMFRFASHTRQQQFRTTAAVASARLGIVI